MKILILEIIEGKKADETISILAESEGIDLKDYTNDSVLFVSLNDITNEQTSTILKTLFGTDKNQFPPNKTLKFKRVGLLPDKNNKYYVAEL